MGAKLAFEFIIPSIRINIKIERLVSDISKISYLLR